MKPQTRHLTPQQVNDEHLNADTDSSPGSLHHTLGIGDTQSSPGTHNHDGRNSRQLKALTPTTVTGSRGGNAALTSLLTQLAAQGIIIDNTVI